MRYIEVYGETFPEDVFDVWDDDDWDEDDWDDVSEYE